MKIRKGIAAAIVFTALMAAAPATVPAQEAKGKRPPSARRTVPANTPYLLGGLLFVWGGIWVYLASLHRTQRRLEKLIERLEEQRP